MEPLAQGRVAVAQQGDPDSHTAQDRHGTQDQADKGQGGKAAEAVQPGKRRHGESQQGPAAIMAAILPRHAVQVPANQYGQRRKRQKERRENTGSRKGEE